MVGGITLQKKKRDSADWTKRHTENTRSLYRCVIRSPEGDWNGENKGEGKTGTQQRKGRKGWVTERNEQGQQFWPEKLGVY